MNKDKLIDLAIDAGLSKEHNQAFRRDVLQLSRTIDSIEYKDLNEDVWIEIQESSRNLFPKAIECTKVEIPLNINE